MTSPAVNDPPRQPGSLPEPVARPDADRARPIVGLSAIALAIAFNIPYALLALTYDYPAVLRRPAGEALDLFAAGGPALVLTWHAFALSALAFAPVAVALALTPRAIATRPALSIGAAIAGSMGGLVQAIGLWRWVFVVPSLAQVHADAASAPEARLAAEQGFLLIHQYGGVAMGEHIGQTLTAAFAVLIGAGQWRDGRRIAAVLGFTTALAILIGVNEGVAIALGQSGEAFALATIAGFLGLTAWLVATGISCLRPAPAPR